MREKADVDNIMFPLNLLHSALPKCAELYVNYYEANIIQAQAHAHTHIPIYRQMVFYWKLTYAN